jgi:DNA-binding transcriptional LysR family regulator
MAELGYSDSFAAMPEGVVWDDFRAFIAVTDAGSLRKAALSTATSQPTLSRQIQRLEKALGLQLFDRVAGRLRLTREGRRVLDDARAAQIAFARAYSRGSHGSLAKGDCRLVVGDGLATYWLPKFLAIFSDLHPNIELKLLVPSANVGAKSDLFDINIHYYPHTLDELVTRALGNLHLMPFASRRYLARFGTPQSFFDLTKHRLLELSHYVADMGSWVSLIEDASEVTTQLFTNQSTCLVENIRSGMGIGLLPSYAALLDDDLVALDLGRSFPLPMYASFSKDAVRKPHVRALLNFLTDVVFNNKTMPWFANGLAMPAEDWPAIFARCLVRAQESVRDAQPVAQAAPALNGLTRTVGGTETTLQPRRVAAPLAARRDQREPQTS